jgi:hypothetical protein
MDLEILGKEDNRIKRGVNYSVWQDNFHPIELVNNEMIGQRLEYIHNNPVEEEIVIEAVDYKYSSAVDYAGGVGALAIEQLNDARFTKARERGVVIPTIFVEENATEKT